MHIICRQVVTPGQPVKFRTAQTKIMKRDRQRFNIAQGSYGACLRKNTAAGSPGEHGRDFGTPEQRRGCPVCAVIQTAIDRFSVGISLAREIPGEGNRRIQHERYQRRTSWSRSRMESFGFGPRERIALSHRAPACLRARASIRGAGRTNATPGATSHEVTFCGAFIAKPFYACAYCSAVFPAMSLQGRRRI